MESSFTVTAFLKDEEWKPEDAPGPFVRLALGKETFDVETRQLPSLLWKIIQVAKLGSHCGIHYPKWLELTYSTADDARDLALLMDALRCLGTAPLVIRGSEYDRNPLNLAFKNLGTLAYSLADRIRGRAEEFGDAPAWALEAPRSGLTETTAQSVPASLGKS